MRKLLAALMLTSSVAFAADLVLLDIPASELGKSTHMESRLSVNLTEGTVTGILTSYYEDSECRYQTFNDNGPGNIVCTTRESRVTEKSVLIENMGVVENQIMLKTNDGDVICGKIKPAGLLKKKLKIVFNGNCQLTNRSVKAAGEKRVQLVMITK